MPSGCFLKKKPPRTPFAWARLFWFRSKRRLSCRAPGRVIATRSRQAFLPGVPVKAIIAATP